MDHHWQAEGQAEQQRQQPEEQGDAHWQWTTGTHTLASQLAVALVHVWAHQISPLNLWLLRQAQVQTPQVTLQALLAC